MELYVKPEHDEQGLKVGPMQWIIVDGLKYFWRFFDNLTSSHFERMKREIKEGKQPIGDSRDLAANRYFYMSKSLDPSSLVDENENKD
ncbi:hypothetical protein ZPAH1_orf00038 [Aeromonas phage ZPAH1]|nr:hypothetical protein ZPAH1_orf00038 [Aeromonas phage ZPAH1]